MYIIIFLLENTWPGKAKFYLERPWEGGTEVNINGLGHMTKMATMPIYYSTCMVKNFKKFFRTRSLMISNDSSSIMFTEMMTLG